MNELVKALKNFIVRDIIYIIGGVSVILSFLYLFNRINIIGKDTSTATYLFIAGLAYVVGYCIQDTASWIRIVTVASYFEPWLILEWFYRRFLHRQWENIFSDIRDGENRREQIFRRIDEAELRIQEQTKASPSHTANRERITYLMMVGTTIGPCGLLSGLLLLCKAFPTFFQNFPKHVPLIVLPLFIALVAFTILFPKFLAFLIPSAFIMLVAFSKKLGFDMSLALFVILLSVCLIILAWIKALQLMKNTEGLYNFYRNRKFREYDP